MGNPSDVAYAMTLSPAPEGGFVVTCRDLPVLVTQGEDEADALAQAADALDEVMALYARTGEVLPMPSVKNACEHLVSPRAIATDM